MEKFPQPYKDVKKHSLNEWQMFIIKKVFEVYELNSICKDLG